MKLVLDTHTFHYNDPFDRLLIAQMKAEQAWLVSVSKWRPEESHDAIAQHLVHRALGAMHRVHHMVNDGIKHPSQYSPAAVALPPGRRHLTAEALPSPVPQA